LNVLTVFMDLLQDLRQKNTNDKYELY
jgi:hypothetical protein